MFEKLEDIKVLLDKHDIYRNNCLNLIASENYSSKTVRSYLGSDFNSRYGCYVTLHLEQREYTGNKVITEFEKETQDLTLDIFGGKTGKYVDLRPISGHMAGMSTVLGVMEPGETVIEVSLKDWGHGLVGPMCLISQLNATIDVQYMPFIKGAVDLEGLIAMVRKVKPKLVIFGGSGTLTQEPVKAFAPIAKELNIIVAYDASHITGLIAGKQWMSPLDEGADILFGSTHKSFPGPQGGFIITKEEKYIKLIGDALSPSLVTSHHIGRLPGFAASLLEMKKYGKAYAIQTVKNTKALAKAMVARGFDVIGNPEEGYSDTHLLLADLGNFTKTSPGAVLEEAGILISDDFSGASVQIRIGTPEITRRGMKEKDMDDIAELFKQVIIDHIDAEELKDKVLALVSNFTSVAYAFDDQEQYHS